MMCPHSWDIPNIGAEALSVHESYVRARKDRRSPCRKRRQCAELASRVLVHPPIPRLSGHVAVEPPLAHGLDLDQMTPTVHARRVPRREELAMKELVASDVMNTQVLAVRLDITVRELATLLTENEISGAPVTDGHGRLLGMVSLSDIAQGEADEAGLAPSESDPEATVHGWEEEATSDEMRELHVEGHIMTPTAYTVPDDTPVSRLARTMIAGRVHRLLVVRDQRVVGIVTSLDLLTLLSGDVKSRRRASRGRKPAAAKPRRRNTVTAPRRARRPRARG